MDAWQYALIGIATILPPAFAYWSGGQVMRRLDDAALPERLTSRRTQLGYLSYACLLIVLWTAPFVGTIVAGTAIFLGVTAGSFPLRKAVLNEAWGLGAYVVHAIKNGVLWHGPSWLLAVGSIAVLSSEEQRWGIAFLVMALFTGLTVWWGPLFRALMRARETPLTDELRRIVAQARTANVALYRYSVDGAFVPYAFALPSVRRPAVFLTDDLGTVLEPDELRAVFAHEVAHLEHWTPRRLWKTWLLSGAIAVLVTVGTAVAVDLDGPAGIFPLIPFVAFSALSARSRADEEAADRRAAELCGDAEALKRSLEKLHAAVRLPRRWTAEQEHVATHPSLAQRLQALQPAEASAAPAPIPTRGFRIRTPHDAILLEPSRLLLLRGVPESAGDPVRWPSAAARVVVIDYADLASATVRAGLLGGPALALTEKNGRQHRVRLRPADVAGIQTALAAIDHLLSRSQLMPRPMEVLRRLAGITCIATAFTVSAPTLFFRVGLLAAIVPSRTVTWTLALAILLNMHARGPMVYYPTGTLTQEGHPALNGWGLPLFVALAAVLLWIVLVRARRELEFRRERVWAVALPFASALEVAVSAIHRHRLTWEDTPWVLAVYPDVRLALFTGAGALLFFRSWPMRALGIVIAVSVEYFVRIGRLAG